MTEPDKPLGKILSFYSYKGGTGRSLTLANVAWVLASNGKRVLAIDWDFEAPGLHRYFAPFLHDPGLAQTDGLIEFVRDFADAAVTPTADDPAETEHSWYEDWADLSRVAVSIDYPFKEPGASTSSRPAGRTPATASESGRSTGRTSTSGSRGASSWSRSAATSCAITITS